MKQNEVTIDNVELLALREKIAGYKMLFGALNPHVQVKGTFRDKKDELLFLNYRFYSIDISTLGRRYMDIYIDSGIVRATPVDDVIAQVKLFC